MKTINSPAHKIFIPQTFLEKLQGVIGKEYLLNEGVFLFENCNWVHSFGVSAPIQLFFVSKDGRVVKKIQRFKSNRFSAMVMGAHFTLEASVECSEEVIAQDILFLKENLYFS